MPIDRRHRQTSKAAVTTLAQTSLSRRRALLLGAAVPLGLPFIARAQGAGPIRIGLSYAHAGIQGPSAPFVKAGAEVALVRHGGKVLGQTVELVDSDETDVPGTKANMKALIETHKVVAVVGGSESSRSIALQEIAGQVGIPLLIHTSSHDDLSGRLCNRWSYRISIPYGVQYHAISPYLTGYGKKWFMLGVDGTSGPAMMKVARAGMVEAGAREIGSEVASQELKDFSAVIQKIVAAKPDVVVGALQGTSLTSFLKAWQAASVGTQIPYAQIGLTDADLWNAGAQAAQETGGVYTKTWDFASTRLTEDDKAFVAAFAKRMNGQMPETRAWQAYTAMHALLTAIDKAGSTEADKIRLGLDGFREGAGDLPLAFRDFDHQMLHRVPVFETKSTISDKYHWLDGETYIPEKVADIGSLYGTAETGQCKGITA